MGRKQKIIAIVILSDKLTWANNRIEILEKTGLELLHINEQLRKRNAELENRACELAKVNT